MQPELEAEMKKASAARDFEKAAELRDLIHDLNATWKRTEKFERVPYTLPLSINPGNDLAELAKVLNLPAPPQRIEGFDISNISGTFAVASLVSFKNGRPDRANYRRFKIKTVEGQDDFASMAEVVKRRYSRLLNESGVGQASRLSQTSISRKDGDRRDACPTLLLPNGIRGRCEPTAVAPRRAHFAARGAGHRAANLRRAAIRTRPGHRPSGHQTGKHFAGPPGPREGG
jgi:excinuclease UvrABC nuclease subunit